MTPNGITYEIHITDTERISRAAIILRTLAAVPVSPCGAETQAKVLSAGGPVPPRLRMVARELSSPAAHSLTGGGESSSPPLEQKRRQPGTKQTAAHQTEDSLS